MITIIYDAFNGGTNGGVENKQTRTASQPVLRLFVWEEFSPDYINGLAVAIAETIQDAQDAVVKSLGGREPHDWGPVREYSLEAPIAFAVRGG